MKIIDKFKEKQLKTKFDKISSLNESPFEHDLTTSTKIEAQNSNQAQFEAVNWRKFLKKDSYRNWLTSFEHEDIYNFFSNNNVKILKTKILKNKDNHKKLQFIVRNTDHKFNLATMICLNDFINLENPVVLKSKKYNSVYYINFDVKNRNTDNYGTKDDQPKQTREFRTRLTNAN